jgi:hypothetical protein
MVFVGILLVLCCICIVLAAMGLAGFYIYDQKSGPVAMNPLEQDAQPTQSREFVTPTDAFIETEVPAVATNVPLPASASTLDLLEQTIVPDNDPRDLACRLGGKCNLPETFPTGPFVVGDKQKFWVSNVVTNTNFQVEATLQYMTDHAYFWVQDGVQFTKTDAIKLVDAFETKMYPTNREFFGSEWTPGVDEDPRIYMLYARGIGGSVAGYFSSPDEYAPGVQEYSNAHEMFVFNADNSPLDGIYTYGVLAHEFQHMIHWYQDRNESTWLNEGFAELAVLLNGYYVSYADDDYALNADVQLNDWGANPGTNGAHYGSSFLFVTYFLDRFGESATKALVRHPQNSIESVDAVLSEIGAVDSRTGQPIGADDFFMDWAVTNYLSDGSVADGRFRYHNYTDLPQFRETDTLSNCPTEYSGSVKQYGVDYLKIQCRGTYTLHFEGDASVPLVPTEVYSGQYAFWSNVGDQSNMTLTREFDLSAVSGPVKLQYHTWFDIEQDYDYLYILASVDDGKTWQILLTPSGTAEDPSGNSYGWAYSGTSQGWLDESVDLSQFAGKKIQLRFEYVTDTAVHGDGFMLDDVAIPEIGYFTDFENGPDGWDAAGFVLVQNALPQTFRLAVITRGGETKVENFIIEPGQPLDINLELQGDDIVVISGMARFTRLPGNYSLTIR